MRALWSDRPNCSHNVSQKVKRTKSFSEVSWTLPAWTEKEAFTGEKSPRESLKSGSGLRVKF